MKDPARASLLIFGMALLFVSPHIRPQDLGTARFLGVIAIGVVSTLTAALVPERWTGRG